MPSKTTSTAAVAPKRFELPALDFKFASLTEGTNIPPPLPSPVEEAPAPVRSETPCADDMTTTVVTTTALTRSGKKRAADSPISPVSPTLSMHRPGSIRRLFSRTLLNASYVEGEPAAATAPRSPEAQRPQSQASVLTDKRSKRSSGWFRRLTGGGDYSSDLKAMRSAEDVRRPPPPPMIPELSQLEAKVGLKDGSSFGADLFKDIK